MLSRASQVPYNAKKKNHKSSQEAKAPDGAVAPMVLKDMMTFTAYYYYDLQTTQNVSAPPASISSVPQWIYLSVMFGSAGTHTRSSDFDQLC